MTSAQRQTDRRGNRGITTAKGSGLNPAHSPHMPLCNKLLHYRWSLKNLCPLLPI